MRVEYKINACNNSIHNKAYIAMEMENAKKKIKKCNTDLVFIQIYKKMGDCENVFMILGKSSNVHHICASSKHTYLLCSMD